MFLHDLTMLGYIKSESVCSRLDQAAQACFDLQSAPVNQHVWLAEDIELTIGR